MWLRASEDDLRRELYEAGEVVLLHREHAEARALPVRVRAAQNRRVGHVERFAFQQYRKALAQLDVFADRQVELWLSWVADIREAVLNDAQRVRRAVSVAVLVVVEPVVGVLLFHAVVAAGENRVGLADGVARVIGQDPVK